MNRNKRIAIKVRSLHLIVLFGLSVNLMFAQNVNLISQRCDSLINYVGFSLDKFTYVNKKEKIPCFIKKEVVKRQKMPLVLSNPGRKFNRTDDINPFLTNRQLVKFGQLNNIYFLVYNQGGYSFDAYFVILELADKKVIRYVELITGGIREENQVEEVFRDKVRYSIRVCE